MKLPVLATVLLCIASATAAVAQDKALAISAGRILVGDGTVIEGGVVLVKGGKIVAVGKNVAIPADAVEMKYPEGVITPGLIDAGGRELGGRDDEQAREISADYRVLDALDLTTREMEQLAREGVTTIAATAGRRNVIGARTAVVKTGQGADGRVLVEAREPRLVLTSETDLGNRSPSRGSPNDVFVRRPNSQMGTVFVARDFFMKAQEQARGRRAGALEHEDPALAILEQVMARKLRLRSYGLYLHEIATALRLAREFGYDITLEGGDEAWRMTAELAAAKAPVIYGPVVLDPTGQGPFAWMRGTARRKESAAALLHRAGLVVALTAAGSTGEYGLARQVTHAIRYGLAPDAALAAVTSVPARLLGVEDRVGRVKVGLDADLIVWSGEPFEATSRQRAVFIDGKTIAGQVF